jgi:phenylacetate-CoA ligase
MDRFQFASRDEIDVQVRQNLCQLLLHAARTVPYYRDLIDVRNLSEATAISMLQRMPILTKDLIRQEGKRLISERAARRSRWNTSGGSTGEPVRLLQDRDMLNKSRATELLFMRWAGHARGEPHLFIWGVPQATFHEKISYHEILFRLIHNETYLNCYRITDDTLRVWIECINARRPTLIEAYADAIYDLSCFIVEKRSSVRSPRAIITSAGVLTPHMREVVTRAFRCPVLNRYGSREVSAVACSCMSGHELHVNEYGCYVEVVDQQECPCEQGIEGDILVTLLANYAMPLIRYRIQDRGIWASGPCPCGRTTRRLAAVSGRQSDYLLALDASRINGTALTTLLYPVCSIRRYQYRQVQPDRVVLAVVPKEGVALDALKTEMEAPLGRLRIMLGGVSVELAVVDKIMPSNSGKYRYIINDVAKA